jgi:hypothetical protein
MEDGVVLEKEGGWGECLKVRIQVMKKVFKMRLDELRERYIEAFTLYSYDKMITSEL